MSARARSLARRAGGFTIIELMATLTLLAVLSALAAPSVREMIATARLKSHNSALQTSLALARSEAINRKKRVVVCKSADQASCTTVGDWRQGWIVFVDTNDNATVDAGEPILQKVSSLSGTFVLRGSGNVGDYVSFTSSGAAKASATTDTLQTGVFTLCQPDSINARQIEIFATGRLSLTSNPVTGCS